MNTLGHSGHPHSLWFWLAVAWIIIIAKCILVTWAISHWQIPIAAGWIITPTLTLASVATMLVVVRFRFGDPIA